MSQCHKVCYNGIKADCKSNLIRFVSCCSNCKGNIQENKKQYILIILSLISIIIGSFGFVITAANSLIYNEKYLILGICLLIISILPWIIYAIQEKVRQVYKRYKEEYLPGSYTNLDL